MTPVRSILAIVLTCFAGGGATAQVTGLQGWNIFLDPGHSATENMGIYNYSEAEKNLRVGLALRDMLLTQTDIDTVYMSRTNDLQIVGLSQRSDLANTLGADWFHSIHSDASSSQSANSTLLLWGQLLSGVEKSPPGGSEMSDPMVDNLTRGMRTNTRGSWGDCSFYRSFIPDACSSGGPYLSVNRRTSMPSELSESGFHTNPAQNQRNMNADWKRLEAQTFFWSILDFWSIPRPPASIVTGYVTDLETGELINGATVSAAGQEYTTDTYDSLFRFYSNDPDQLRNGFYYLEGVGPGSHTMTVSADGYDTDTYTVTMTDTFFTFFDVQLTSNQPPRVLDSTPEEGDPAFSIVAPIVLDFSRKMDRASVEASFSIDPPVAGTFSWSNGDFRMSFRPESLPALTPVTVRLAASALGAFGHALDGNGDGIPGDDFVLSFTTGSSDTQAPTVVRTFPAANQLGVDIQPIISAVFDEELDPTSVGAGQIALLTISGVPVGGTVTHTVAGGTSVVTFFPGQKLARESVYLVRVMPGVRDLVGNERRTISQFAFTTGEEVVEKSIFEDFETDLESNWWEPVQSESTTGVIPASTFRTAEPDVVNLLRQSTASLRIDFEWDESSSEWLLREYLAGGFPKGVVFDSRYDLGAYVFGDGSGTLFRLAVQDRYPGDVPGNVEVSPWFTVDWLGWRLVTWDLETDGTGEWIGDGVLDGDLVFDSIQLSRSPGAAATSSIVVDDLWLRGLITDVEDVDELPAAFAFFQNAPNPFSSTTSLRLSIPEPGDLMVAVYDILGQEVARIADQTFVTAGSIELIWDARSVSSGLYLATARLGGRVITIPMIVAR